jgi:hypothetical protein
MEDLKLDENSTITIPVRNLLAMIFATAVAVMGYFEVTNRIAVLERETMLFKQEMKQNSEFRVKWPRGELGSLPDDMMQNAQLMTIHQRLEEITQIKDQMNNLRIDLNRENGINQTQHEKLETLFALWNEQIIKKED